MRKKKKVNANETYMQTVMRRFRAHHLAKISLVILVVVGLAALFAPVVAPYDPDAIVGTFSGAPCKEFILGTDQLISATPPKYPAIRPSTTPITVEITVARIPTSREILVAYKSLLNTSLPI